MDWIKLHHKITSSRKLAAVSTGAECLYYRAYVLADDFGRFHAEPQQLRGQALTLRKVTNITAERWLLEIWLVGLIELYLVDEELLLEIVAYEEYQKPRKDVKPRQKYPAPIAYLQRPATERAATGRHVALDKIRLEQIRTDKNRTECHVPAHGTGRDAAKKPAKVDIKLNQLLCDLILKNDTKSKVQRMAPTTQETWLTECRRLREIDKRTPQEIAFVIEWTQEDSFEKTNVLSMPKLRKRFSQLLMKAKRAKGFDKFVEGGDW